MAFFAFLPTIGEAIAIVLGLMRSNVWLTGSAMLAGKTLRYIVVLATFRGAAIASINLRCMEIRKTEKPTLRTGTCCCWPTRSKPRWPTTSAAERATPPADGGRIVGQYVLIHTRPFTAEVVNIAVVPDRQRQRHRHGPYWPTPYDTARRCGVPPARNRHGQISAIRDRSPSTNAADSSAAAST